MRNSIGPCSVRRTHWRTADGDDILREHGWQASSQRPTTMVGAAEIGNDSDGGEEGDGGDINGGGRRSPHCELNPPFCGRGLWQADRHRCRRVMAGDDHSGG
jgi:hypothetical protein